MQHGSPPNFHLLGVAGLLFPGAGELASLCREKDWSATPLGPVEAWPSALRVTASLVVASPVSMVLLWGPDMVQIYNDAYRKIMGERHPAGLGQPIRLCWPEAWPFVSSACERVRAQRAACSFEDRRFVIERQGRPEEAFFTLGYTPVFDDSGAVGGVMATVVETTDAMALRRAEAMTSESEQRFRLMADAVPQIVWVTDQDGRIEFFNQQWSGYTGIGYNPADAAEVAAAVVHPEDRELTMERFEQARRTGGTFQVEHRIRSASGEYRWFLVRAQPHRDPPSGRITRWYGASVDIHDRTLAEKALRENNRRKDEFLAMLAHELRNPLAPIGSAAQLLQMVKMDPARLQYTSQIITRQVNHMTNLIDDLLDVSRVTRGLVQIERAPLDIRHIATEAVEQVAPLIQARRHRLALHLTPEPTMVDGDRKRLVQVVANILNNAAKYTEEGGNILLRTDVQDAKVVIEVTDDGIGMTQDMIEHAFGLFTQAERTPDRSAGGLGIGLALVKSLVELHGGTVECDSAGPDKGSTFTVSLPRLQASVPALAVRAGEIAVQRALMPLRILVVDDNVDAATTLAMLLEAAGHVVSVEHGARRAIARALEERPDVFVLDIGLPEMDGNDLARHLRSLPETAHAVYIAVTGYGQQYDRARSREAGFDHHLVKPVEAAVLMDILSSAEDAGRAPRG